VFDKIWVAATCIWAVPPVTTADGIAVHLIYSFAPSAGATSGAVVAEGASRVAAAILGRRGAIGAISFDRTKLRLIANMVACITTAGLGVALRNRIPNLGLQRIKFDVRILAESWYIFVRAVLIDGRFHILGTHVTNTFFKP
jgi:hypothetical protein